MTGLTTIIITLNEEENIEGCIDSVINFSDEVIVVDSKSTDNTVKIAKNAGAIVYENQFVDYATQKNYALSKAKGDWVFFIDADERSTAELNKEILQSIKSIKYDAYSIPRKNYVLGQFIKHTRWQPELDRHVWLFKKSRAKWVGQVHEEVIVDGRIGKIRSAKLHYQDKTITEFIGKLNKYSTIEAKAKYDNKQAFSLFSLLIQPVYNFLIRYIYRLGFLDGWRGFVLSYLMAFYHFQIWVKLWSLENNKK